MPVIMGQLLNLNPRIQIIADTDKYFRKKTMKTNKLIGIILLVVGSVLLYFGLNATEAPLEEVTEAVTGKYSDETMYYLVGGGAALILGLVLSVKK